MLMARAICSRTRTQLGTCIPVVAHYRHRRSRRATRRQTRRRPQRPRRTRRESRETRETRTFPLNKHSELRTEVKPEDPFMVMLQVLLRSFNLHIPFKLHRCRLIRGIEMKWIWMIRTSASYVFLSFTRFLHKLTYNTYTGARSSAENESCTHYGGRCNLQRSFGMSSDNSCGESVGQFLSHRDER